MGRAGEWGGNPSHFQERIRGKNRRSKSQVSQSQTGEDISAAPRGWVGALDIKDSCKLVPGKKWEQLVPKYLEKSRGKYMVARC